MVDILRENGNFGIPEPEKDDLGVRYRNTKAFAKAHFEVATSLLNLVGRKVTQEKVEDGEADFLSTCSSPIKYFDGSEDFGFRFVIPPPVFPRLSDLPTVPLPKPTLVDTLTKNSPTKDGTRKYITVEAAANSKDFENKLEQLNRTVVLLTARWSISKQRMASPSEIVGGAGLVLGGDYPGITFGALGKFPHLQELACDGRLFVFVTKETPMELAMSRVESRMAGLESRMAGLESRMVGLESRMVGLESRMVGLESNMKLVLSVLERAVGKELFSQVKEEQETQHRAGSKRPVSPTAEVPPSKIAKAAFKIRVYNPPCMDEDFVKANFAGCGEIVSVSGTIEMEHGQWLSFVDVEFKNQQAVQKALDGKKDVTSSKWTKISKNARSFSQKQAQTLKQPSSQQRKALQKARLAMNDHLEKL